MANYSVRRNGESEDAVNKRRERVFQERLEAGLRGHGTTHDEPKPDPKAMHDELGEELVREFLLGVETNRHVAGEASDDIFDEEEGGPFIITDTEKPD